MAWSGSHGMAEPRIIEQPRLDDGVDGVERAIVAAFEAIRSSLSAGASVLVVLSDGDLLGQGDPADAAVASALLGLVRAAALEGEKQGWMINAVSRRDPGVCLPTEAIAEMALSGQLIRVGTGHLGRILP